MPALGSARGVAGSASARTFPISTLSSDVGPAINAYLAGLANAGYTGDIPQRLPAGVFKVATPIVVPSGICLLGSGYGFAGGTGGLAMGTILQANAAVSPLSVGAMEYVVGLGDNITGLGGPNAAIRNLQVDGGLYSNTNPYPACYAVYNGFGFAGGNAYAGGKARIEDCVITGGWAVSLFADLTSDALTLRGVHIDPGNGGLFHSGQALSLMTNAGDLNAIDVRTPSGGKVFQVAGGLHSSCHYDGSSPLIGNTNVVVNSCVLTGTAASPNKVITTTSNGGVFPAGVRVGMVVAQTTGIGQGQQVASINAARTQVTLTNNITTTTTEQLTFGYYGQYTGYPPVCNMTDSGGQFFAACYIDSTCAPVVIAAVTQSGGTGTVGITSSNITTANLAPGMLAYGPGIGPGVIATVTSVGAGVATLSVTGTMTAETNVPMYFGATCQIDRTQAPDQSVYVGCNFYNNQNSVGAVPSTFQGTAGTIASLGTTLTLDSAATVSGVFNPATAINPVTGTTPATVTQNGTIQATNPTTGGLVTVLFTYTGVSGATLTGCTFLGSTSTYTVAVGATIGVPAATGIPTILETTVNRGGCKIQGGVMHSEQFNPPYGYWSYFISAMAANTVVHAIDVVSSEVVNGFTSNPAVGQLMGIYSGTKAGAFTPVFFGAQFAPGTNSPSFPSYTTGNAPAAVVSGVYYDTTLNAFRFCTSAGTWTTLTLP